MADKYLVLTGLSWGEDPDTGDFAHRAEPGEVRDDLNPGSIPWLLEAGHIQKVIEAASVGFGKEKAK